MYGPGFYIISGKRPTAGTVKNDVPNEWIKINEKESVFFIYILFPRFLSMSRKLAREFETPGH